MTAIQKQIVTNANWTVGREGNAVSGIVLHTMVGTTPSAFSRFNDPKSSVSVHYGVSLDGSIHQWVEEANTAYQAGNWPVNLKTIGIEHEDNGNANDGVRTAAEYESSSDVVADICRRYKIPCDTNHIFLHKNVIDKSAYPGGTACPDGLDTNKIISMAAAKIGDEMITKELLQKVMGAFFGPGFPKQVDYDNWVGKNELSNLIDQCEIDPRRKAYYNTVQLGFACLNRPPSDAQAKVDQIKKIVG